MEKVVRLHKKLFLKRKKKKEIKRITHTYKIEKKIQKSLLDDMNEE